MYWVTSHPASQVAMERENSPPMIRPTKAFISIYRYSMVRGRGHDFFTRIHLNHVAQGGRQVYHNPFCFLVIMHIHHVINLYCNICSYHWCTLYVTSMVDLHYLTSNGMPNSIYPCYSISNNAIYSIAIKYWRYRIISFIQTNREVTRAIPDDSNDFDI